jgi:hypothetical protein
LLGWLVSIQLVSPASGESNENETIESRTFPGIVSIQLVSPASGEVIFAIAVFGKLGFHSISFPSEWGEETVTLINLVDDAPFPFN